MERFSRQELTQVIQPHVLRAVVKLQSQFGALVTEEQVQATRLTPEELRALVQTKRLVLLADGQYRIQV